MRPSFKPPRAIRAIQMQAALAEALENTRAYKSIRARRNVPPLTPAGMKPLITPHEALSLRQPSGDATLLRVAFARYLFWRALLGERRPTKASAERCLRRLYALACWHYAVQAHAQGLALPLKQGKSAREVPATVVSALHLPGAHQGKGTKTKRAAKPSVTRADDGNDDGTPPDEPPIPGRTDEEYDFGDYLTDYLGFPEDDPLSTLDSDEVSPDELNDLLDADGIDALDFWENWGDLADLPLDTVIDPSRLGLNQDDYTVAGDVLTFAPLLAEWIGSGLSDLQIAQMIDWAAAGQTSAWAGQTFYDDAGIAGTFDIRDPYFYDFLREQSGWLINPSGVGVIDYLRRDLAETMWSLMGGDVGPGISVTALARELASQYGPDLAEGTRYSADYRAYLIAVTETARAESFGEFVAMWSLGAKNKMWIVNAGACLICIGNEEAGAIPITQSFPGGFQGPPQHPLCRCSVAAAVPDTFNPDDWQSRSPSDLDPYLFNWAGTQWPDVDLSDLSDLESVELPDLDESDFEMAQQPDATRAARKRHRARPTARILAAYDVAQRMLAVTEQAAEAWARAAHVRYPPQSERDLYSLATRLRKGHDEMPDAREATEHYIVALRAGLRDVLRAAVKEAAQKARA